MYIKNWKFILCISWIVCLFVSPWLNFLLVHNAMLADPTISLNNLRDFVWGIQIFGGLIIGLIIGLN